MQYLLLIYSDLAASPAPGSPEEMAEFEAFMALSNEMQEAGVLVGGEPLEPPSTATTVRGTSGEILTVDGPFAETKEALGGYTVIEAPDLDAALGWARRMPHLSYGSVEVRPIMAIPEEFSS